MTQREEAGLERKWHDRISIVEIVVGLMVGFVVLGSWVGAVEVRLQSVEEYREGIEPTRIETIKILSMQEQALTRLSNDFNKFLVRYENDRKEDVIYKLQEQKNLQEFYKMYDLKPRE
jgi:hypothetical protein